LRVLYVAGPQRTGGWLARAFAADSATEVIVEEVAGAVAGLVRLRDDLFDAAIISHEPDELDALDLIEGIRAGGSERLPLVVLGTPGEHEVAPLAFEAGADAYLCVHTATTRSLIWQLARARERHCLIAENRRLRQQQRHRLKQEHDEANRLLGQQRALISDLERICRQADHAGEVERPQTADARRAAVGAGRLPESLVERHRDLLRAYVVMGTGNLTDEMRRLADLLVSADVSAQQAMQLHLRVLEEMVAGLGSRSARHVINRADLLVLDVMIHLAEGYRRRSPG
jgi:DNA-binding response OmpR family regulator